MFQKLISFFTGRNGPSSKSALIQRYVIFGWKEGRPNGGAYDVIGRAAYLAEARRQLQAYCKSGKRVGHIFDVYGGKLVP